MASSGGPKRKRAEDAAGPEEKKRRLEPSGPQERSQRRASKKIGNLRTLLEALKEGTLRELPMVPLEPWEAPKLAKALRANKTVQIADFSKNWEPAYAPGSQMAFARAQIITHTLRGNKTLQKVDFTYNRIGDAGAVRLARALEVNKTLKQLILRDTHMGDEGLVRLAQALKVNSTLEYLDLSANKFSDAAFQALMDALKVNKGLRGIELSSMPWTAHRVLGLLEALRENKTLQDIGICDAGLDDDSLAALADGLMENKAVQGLRLFGNKITEWGVEALCEALKANAAWRRLDLSENKIGDEGAAMLAAALMENKTLQTLGLAAAGVGEEGAKGVARALTANRSLQEVDLSRNKLGAGGIAALAKALQANTTLRSVNLTKVFVDQQGADKLADALKVNKTLHDITLASNNIGSAGAKAIAEALKVNSTLLHLDLTNTSMTTTGATALGAALKVNKTLKRLMGDLAVAGVQQDGLTLAGLAEEAKQAGHAAMVPPVEADVDESESPEEVDEALFELPAPTQDAKRAAKKPARGSSARWQLSPAETDSWTRLQRFTALIEEKFKDMVGQDKVKEELTQLAAQTIEYELVGKKERRPLRMIFYGPPGTGKTSVARKMFDIFRELGIVPKSPKEAEFVERTGNKLRGTYLGGTGELVRKAFERVKAGVFFLDECHQINPKEHEGGYDREALSEFMSQSSSSPCHIILAGYPKHVSKFLSHDPGMERRFLTGAAFHFGGYTAEELTEIFLKMCESNDPPQRLTREAKAQLSALVERFPCKMRRGQNAGLISNWLAAATKARSYRVIAGSGGPIKAGDPRLYELTLEDLENGIKALLENTVPSADAY